MTISEDLKQWYAIACPTTGVRFDLRTLELMDSDHDGRVRSPEVQAALECLKEKGVFSKAMIDGIIAELKAFDDRTLRAKVTKNAKAMAELVKTYFHCG